MGRIILHLDMDAFYASVEAQRRDLEGEPIVVCVYSGRSGNSGAVSTCSYEARELGIRSAMPISQAEEIADRSEEEVHFVPVDKQFYRHISDQIKKEILEEEVDIVEQASIDEFYLDVSEKVEKFEEAEELAEELKNTIEKEFGYTASVGIGPNKLVAKIASGEEKPNGMTVVRAEEAEEFIGSLDLEDIHGIGPKTVEKLESIGIRSVKDLKSADRRHLMVNFGEKKGKKLKEKAHGRDDSEVEESKPKQLSRLTTLKSNSDRAEDLKPYLEELADDLYQRIEKEGASFGSVAVLAIDTEMKMHTRSESIGAPVQRKEIIFDRAEKLMNEFLQDFDGEVRRVGVRVKDLEFESGQKSLDAF